jgi:hypothetical protein
LGRERLRRAPLLSERRQRPLARGQRLEFDCPLELPPRPGQGAICGCYRLLGGAEVVDEPGQLRAQPPSHFCGPRRCSPFGKAGNELGLALRTARDLLSQPSSACLPDVERPKPYKEISQLCPPLASRCGYGDQPLRFCKALLRRRLLRLQPGLALAQLLLPGPNDRVKQQILAFTQR